MKKYNFSITAKIPEYEDSKGNLKERTILPDLLTFYSVFDLRMSSRMSLEITNGRRNGETYTLVGSLIPVNGTEEDLLKEFESIVRIAYSDKNFNLKIIDSS